MLAAALKPEFEGVTGAYFKKQKVKKPKKRFYNNIANRELLIRVTEEKLREKNIIL